MFIKKLWFRYFLNYSPIYVDTSYIRGTNKNVKSKNHWRYFTSSLTILELITHYFGKPSEKMFNITKACIMYISKIKVDWRMTEEIFNEAFPNIKKKNIKCGDLKIIYTIFLNANSEDELKKQTKKLNIQSALNYDTFLGGGMSDPEKIKSFVYYFEKAFENHSIQSYLYKNEPEPNNVKEFFYDMYNSKIEDARVFIIKALLMRRELNNDNSPIDGYDYSLELMLSAMAHQLFSKAYTKGNYKRNDMIDLYHLGYVDRKKRIMTNEKIIRDYVNMYQPYSLIEE